MAGLSWLELLEWLKEGQSLATNSSSQDKSQPCNHGEYIGLVVLPGGAVGIFGVALVSIQIVKLCSFYFFFKQNADNPAPKHMRRLTTQQVFCQVHNRLHNRESHRQPLP